jgi:hypothetical protein
MNGKKNDEDIKFDGKIGRRWKGMGEIFAIEMIGSQSGVGVPLKQLSRNKK